MSEERDYAMQRLAEYREYMNGRKQVLMWRDKRVEDITDRDELLEVIYGLSRMLERERQWARQVVEMDMVFAEARR